VICVPSPDPLEGGRTEPAPKASARDRRRTGPHPLANAGILWLEGSLELLLLASSIPTFKRVHSSHSLKATLPAALPAPALEAQPRAWARSWRAGRVSPPPSQRPCSTPGGWWPFRVQLPENSLTPSFSCMLSVRPSYYIIWYIWNKPRSPPP